MRKLFGNTEPEPEVVVSPEEEITEEVQGKHVSVHKSKNIHVLRRVKSELALEQGLEWHFEQGHSYHCVSFGDVDSLTYLRVIVKQQVVEYCLLSTWCMAMTDAKEIEGWLEKGYIKHIDFYVGEIFQASYAGVYLQLEEMVRKFGGRVCVFRNHSKVMCGFGERFDFTIESSANVNTNPRCENTVITIQSEVARFYKEFFDDVKSFNSDFPNWKPYALQKD